MALMAENPYRHLNTSCEDIWTRIFFYLKHNTFWGGIGMSRECLMNNLVFFFQKNNNCSWYLLFGNDGWNLFSNTILEFPVVDWLWLARCISQKPLPDSSSNISLSKIKYDMGYIFRNNNIKTRRSKPLRPKHRSTVGAEVFSIQVVPMMPLLQPQATQAATKYLFEAKKLGWSDGRNPQKITLR